MAAQVDRDRGHDLPVFPAYFHGAFRDFSKSDESTCNIIAVAAVA